jgi:hypothetical protein
MVSGGTIWLAGAIRTATVNLAAALVEHRRRVLLIPSTPQGSATCWLKANPDRARPLRLFTRGGLEELAELTVTSGLEFVPASLAPLSKRDSGNNLSYRSRSVVEIAPRSACRSGPASAATATAHKVASPWRWPT